MSDETPARAGDIGRKCEPINSSLSHIKAWWGIEGYFAAPRTFPRTEVRNMRLAQFDAPGRGDKGPQGG